MLDLVKKYSKVSHIAKTIAFVIVLTLAGTSLLTLLPLRTPIKPFIVLSGSMRPTILEGSIIFVRRGFQDVEINDIITFKRPDKPVENVTHRIVAEEDINGKVVYLTKGDANNANDIWKVSKEAIWGKTLFSIPVLGFIVSFAKTRLGVILLIALPLILIALDEIRIIYKEVRKMRHKTLKKSSKIKTINPIIFLSILFVLSLAYPTSETYAKFSDSVQVPQNQISTNIWTSSSVVINEAMWMGSNDSSNDEWVELRNTSSFPVNLESWKIQGAGISSDSITLSGTIPANGYFLISRLTISTSAISDSISSDQVSSNMSLKNTGEQLILKDSSDIIIDQTPTTWPAGVNGPPEWKSMERNDTPGDGTVIENWHTCNDINCHATTFWDTDGHNWGTPKTANLSENDPSSPTRADLSLSLTTTSISTTPTPTPTLTLPAEASPSSVPEGAMTPTLSEGLPSPTPTEITPSPTPSLELTPTSSPTPTDSPTPTPTPTDTPTPTPASQGEPAPDQPINPAPPADNPAPLESLSPPQTDSLPAEFPPSPSPTTEQIQPEASPPIPDPPPT